MAVTPAGGEQAEVDRRRSAAAGCHCRLLPPCWFAVGWWAGNGVPGSENEVRHYHDPADLYELARPVFIVGLRSVRPTIHRLPPESVRHSALSPSGEDTAGQASSCTRATFECIGRTCCGNRGCPPPRSHRSANPPHPRRPFSPPCHRLRPPPRPRPHPKPGAALRGRAGCGCPHSVLEAGAQDPSWRPHPWYQRPRGA
jgi:hypothetical protein